MISDALQSPYSINGFELLSMKLRAPGCNSDIGVNLRTTSTEETLETHRQHICYWKVCADFSQAHKSQQPQLRYQAVMQRKTIILNGRAMITLAAEHVDPALGFHQDSGIVSPEFTGDTATQDTGRELQPYWQSGVLITEIANAEKDRALMSRLCPSLLPEELLKLILNSIIHISCLKQASAR